MDISLSQEGQRHAQSQFQRDKAKLSIKHRGKLNELEPQLARVYGTEQRLKDHLVEYAQELVSARTQSFIEAYRKFKVKLTEGDISKICFVLEALLRKELEGEITKQAMTPYHAYFLQQFNGIVISAQKDMEHAMREMKLEEPEIEYHYITPKPNVDFSFIADARMRTIVERDYEELYMLDSDLQTKSVLILAGGIIEGLLIDALVKSGEDERETFEKYLKQLIYPAKTKGIITHDNITEVLRVFRNLVHPAREIRDKLEFNPDHARHAKTSVDVIISEVRQWHTNNP